MECIQLNNGYDIPVIGSGTFPQKDSLLKSIPVVLQAGGRLIDTSDNYFNEEYIGEAIQGELKHFEITIISKFSQPTRTYQLEKCFEESKNKLGGCLDIYLLHWPYPFLWKKAWRRMEKLYFDGKCKGIGVCNFEVNKIRKLLSFCKVKPVINQIERHPFFQQNDIVEYCKKEEICVLCYSPIVRNSDMVKNNSVINKIAEKYSVSPNQIILRWDIQHGTVPIPASSSAQHIMSNYDVFHFVLTEDEMRSIDKLDAGMRIRFDSKTRFSKLEKLKFAICALLETLHIPLGLVRKRTVER